ncbi:hypothetical protein HAL013_05640 [Helicobacter ailurogastricus]|uniref:Uncharacterized protein n=1 Tax=Helicobacter ailurogastricus TaxID=1578720 RepID=A0A0K2X585_9HELI|nr:hypothetical protein HAL011_00750 [Helicobacter ailurogastricus]CRF42390.1 hypothetical protein HAL013_05640 [Helicobacter ailurogastricus]CRF44669.1 hypothetical protein HAL09_12660 [Helicobacter ailurogastricus]
MHVFELGLLCLLCKVFGLFDGTLASNAHTMLNAHQELAGVV